MMYLELLLLPELLLLLLGAEVSELRELQVGSRKAPVPLRHVLHELGDRRLFHGEPLLRGISKGGEGGQGFLPRVPESSRSSHLEGQEPAAGEPRPANPQLRSRPRESRGEDLARSGIMCGTTFSRGRPGAQKAHFRWDS